jgi:hypothetical protein
MRKILSTWGMITLLLVFIVGSVAAQSGDDPNVPTSEPAESTLYTHPVVQVLSAYFGRTTRPMMPTPTATETPTEDPSAPPTEEPSETPTPTPVPGPEEFAEQIAMYHDEGVGFGVLVKLYAMAEDAVKACADLQAPGVVVDPTLPACEAVTVEQLVIELQSGTGMGELFKTYGKPALLGVGHVRKALQNQPEVEPTLTTTPEPGLTTSDEQFKNQKSNNGKGNGNGNGNDNSKPPKSKGKNK